MQTKIFQGGCTQSEKRTKPQDIPHVQAKLLRKRLRQNTHRYRKEKEIKLQMTWGRRELGGGGEMEGQWSTGSNPAKRASKQKSLKNAHLWPDCPSPHQPAVQMR